ncbi:MAG TPA: hypothetical protein PKD70_11225 [Saprospiraceae bacterium]|nr:hypothetical protein [Saprospiraceae bacterium]HMP14443.1 hypothetical protein [Saprospiraceae bacterium]
MNNYRIPTNEVTKRKYKDIQERFKELSNKIIKIEGHEVKLRYADIINIIKEEFYYSQENAVIRIINTPISEEE